MGLFSWLFPEEKHSQKEGTPVHIYTDGGALHNGQLHCKAAWSFVVVDPMYAEGGLLEPLPDPDLRQSNNKAELMAIIKALNWCVKNNVKHVRIFSDSQYAIYCTLQYWGRKKNKAYFEEIDRLAHQMEEIKFEWVAGHSGNKHNDMADKLCAAQLGVPHALKQEWEFHKPRPFKKRKGSYQHSRSRR